MKKNLPATVFALTGFLGILCLVTRFWYLSVAMDKNGLLTPHAGNIICWILTAAAVVCCLLLVLPQKPQICFLKTPLAYGSAIAHTAALAVISRQLLKGSTFLETLAGVLAFLACLCAALQLFLRITNKPVPVLSRFPLILFLLIFFLCAYQQWSAQPQTALYVFPLLALVCLTLSAFQRAALELDNGNSTLYLLFAGGAIFFCLAAVPNEPLWLFYLLMAPAVLLDLCAEKAPQEA